MSSICNESKYFLEFCADGVNHNKIMNFISAE